MKVAMVYIFPTSFAHIYTPYARRFVESYLKHSPGKTKHDLHIVVNGSIPMGMWIQEVFSPLKCYFLPHDNSGKDIGGYQVAADIIDCDLMVCLGSPLHFHKPGWLDRMVDVFLDNGPAMYGPWGFQQPLPHLRTSCFWISPELLNSYPVRVGNRYRYQFEHGVDSLCMWTQRMGFEPRMVTWKEVRTMPEWDPIPHEESLVVDQHMRSVPP